MEDNSNINKDLDKLYQTVAEEDDLNTNQRVNNKSKKNIVLIVFIITFLMLAIALTIFSIHSYNEYHSWIKNYASLYYDDINFYGFSMADYALGRGKVDYNKYKISMYFAILSYVSDFVLVLVYIKLKNNVKMSL